MINVNKACRNNATKKIKKKIYIYTQTHTIMEICVVMDFTKILLPYFRFMGRGILQTGKGRKLIPLVLMTYRLKQQTFYDRHFKQLSLHIIFYDFLLKKTFTPPTRPSYVYVILKQLPTCSFIYHLLS